MPGSISLFGGRIVSPGPGAHPHFFYWIDIMATDLFEHNQSAHDTLLHRTNGSELLKNRTTELARRLPA